MMLSRLDEVTCKMLWETGLNVGVTLPFRLTCLSLFAAEHHFFGQLPFFFWKTAVFHVVSIIKYFKTNIALNYTELLLLKYRSPECIYRLWPFFSANNVILCFKLCFQGYIQSTLLVVPIQKALFCFSRDQNPSTEFPFSDGNQTKSVPLQTKATNSSYPL